MKKPDKIKVEKEEYIIGICPTCKGMALVLHHTPTLEMQEWAHKESCRNMIIYLDADENLPIRLHPNRTERRYAFGTGKGIKKKVAA